MSIETAKLIPLLPAAAAVLCGLCCTRKRLRILAGPICVFSIVGAFVISVGVRPHVVPGDAVPSLFLFPWIHIGGLEVDFAYLLDSLTMVMLMVVTGIGSLVAIYACGYMAGDRSYARFFTGVSLFIFAMTTLVMADNLVLLYLGWEGVGLCSYLLIGYYYQKPAAVAAAKKAFIVNRIGDVGFALGIFAVFVLFESVHLDTIFAVAPDKADARLHLFGGEFEICCLLAYDELATVRGYHVNLDLYDRLGPEFGSFVRGVIADEGRHWGAFMELLRTSHRDRLGEAPDVIARIRAAEGTPYRATFVLDHDEALYTDEIFDDAARVLLRTLSNAARPDELTCQEA